MSRGKRGRGMVNANRGVRQQVWLRKKTPTQEVEDECNEHCTDDLF